MHLKHRIKMFASILRPRFLVRSEMKASSSNRSRSSDLRMNPQNVSYKRLIYGGHAKPSQDPYFPLVYHVTRGGDTSAKQNALVIFNTVVDNCVSSAYRL